MKKAAAWALCAAWMALIFFMSAMPGDVSGEQSGTIVDLLLGALETVGVAREAIDPAMLELLLRKGAHMAEYAVLFVLLFRALRLSGARHPGLTALLMSAAYAATPPSRGVDGAYSRCFPNAQKPCPKRKADQRS